MVKIFDRIFATIVVLCALLSRSAAQQMKVELGEEKTAALNAMLNAVYPKAKTYWDIDVYLDAGDGKRTRLAVTPVLTLTGGPVPEFVASINEWDASGRDATELRR